MTLKELILVSSMHCKISIMEEYDEKKENNLLPTCTILPIAIKDLTWGFIKLYGHLEISFIRPDGDDKLFIRVYKKETKEC